MEVAAVATVNVVLGIWRPRLTGLPGLTSPEEVDSAIGAGRLLPFVQAMVVLEILPGDKAASKEVGLNELLGNRCVY
jgi:hypothetical protein